MEAGNDFGQGKIFDDKSFLMARRNGSWNATAAGMIIFVSPNQQTVKCLHSQVALNSFRSRLLVRAMNFRSIFTYDCPNNDFKRLSDSNNSISKSRLFGRILSRFRIHFTYSR